MSKRIVKIILCLGLTGILSSCQGTQSTSNSASSDAWENIRSKNHLVIGVKADAPPFGVRGDDGHYWGFDIDIAQAIAQELDVKASFVTVKSSERIPFILEGKVDFVIASMTITRKRDEQVDFSTTYFQDGQGLLCQQSSNVESYRDLKGKKVGAVKGSTSYYNMMKVQPECQMVEYSDYAEALEGLLSGEADALTSDYLILMGLMQKSQGAKLKLAGKRFTAEPYGVALPQNQSKLRDRVNGAIMAIWDNGTWQDIYDTWFGEGTIYDSDINFHVEVVPE